MIGQASLAVGAMTVTFGVGMLVPTAPTQAQTGLPRFEVASVKRNNSGESNTSFYYQGGRFRAINVTLATLVRHSYQLHESELFGGPSWMNSDRFDILAKGDVAGSPAFPVQLREGPSQLQLMMRMLLQERFKLEVHREEKGIPIYALVLARSDGRLGPTLQRSNVDCVELARAARGSSAVSPAETQGRGSRANCGMAVAPGNLVFGGRDLHRLANTLSNVVGRSVVDRTGLVGAFDIKLTWSPDALSLRRGAALDVPAFDATGPSIFTAVLEQLGLKLESRKESMSVLVIDRADHPTDN